jgi:hypothetical protein
VADRPTAGAPETGSAGPAVFAVVLTAAALVDTVPRALLEPGRRKGRRVKVDAGLLGQLADALLTLDADLDAPTPVDGVVTYYTED